MQGTSLLVSWLNRLRDTCYQENIIEGTDYSLERVVGGKILKFRTGGGSPPAQSSPITPFFFVKSFGDYIIGKNVATGAQVQIAKPYELRNSIKQEYEQADGILYQISYPQNSAGNPLAYVSRTKSAGGDSENQRVTPGYNAAYNGVNPPIPAVIIYAVQLSSTIALSEASDTSTPAGTPITWIDQNYAGRAWAATPDGKV